jgi:hypothetical protein
VFPKKTLATSLKIGLKRLLENGILNLLKVEIILKPSSSLITYFYARREMINTVFTAEQSKMTLFTTNLDQLEKEEKNL